MHVHWGLRLHKALRQDGPMRLAEPAAGGAMTSPDEVHRAIVGADITESTHPVRTNADRLVLRKAMYGALATAFGRHAWPRCRWEDRGDGVLILVPPEVPKSRLVTSLPDRLECALA